MKESILNLEPKNLWKIFYEISKVPRPSKKEGKIRAYIKNFAVENSLDFIEDKAGNICIKIPATKGYENSKTVVLQGHLDMVCEKNKDSNHDFDNDGLKLKLENNWVKAEGTTLGADNGIGVAAALAIALDKEIEHGPIEILLTVDEETGLTGANALSKKMITGDILLNLDSEEDGAFYVGCSGGIDTQAEFKIPLRNNKNKINAFRLSVTGLLGGHSGLDIHKNRGNAIKILALILNKLLQMDLKIANLTGGSKRNAIPREAEAIVLVDKSNVKKVKKEFVKIQASFISLFKGKEDNLKIEFEPIEEKVKKYFKGNFARKIVRTLLALPHGVVSMSADIKDLVETSTNLATITRDKNKIIIGTSQRSSVETAKFNLAEIVKAVFELADADKINTGDGYPGWKPNMNSKILSLAKSVYEKEFNSQPEIKAIHAGLECGILSGKFPNLDMISFGPTIEGAHSPDERVDVDAVKKFYKLIRLILIEIASVK
mgnify:CR=1 FL=1